MQHFEQIRVLIMLVEEGGDCTIRRESQYGWPPKLDAHLEVVEGLLTGDQDFVQVDFRETKNLTITILKDLCYSIDLFYRIINRINIVINSLQTSIETIQMLLEKEKPERPTFSSRQSKELPIH